jgi:formylglycine-generating enzyme required for sulfatase activity
MGVFKKSLQATQWNGGDPQPSASFSQKVALSSSSLQSIATTESETFDELERPIKPSRNVDKNFNAPKVSPIISNDANLRIGSSRTNPIDGAEMLFIPAGVFPMGSKALQGNWDEKPIHDVYLDSYWMHKFPVTNKQYAAFLNAMESQEEIIAKWYQWKSKTALLKRTDEGRWFVKTGYEDHPDVHVSWYGAESYCKWAGGRLPREAEWEKAARGEDGRKYPWGDQKPNCTLANFIKCKIGGTTNVDKCPDGASPYGIMDMAGIVWEWVADWYDADYYENSPSQNPTGPASGTYRVLRGGSWGVDEWLLRASFRLRLDPDGSDGYGFRCLSSVAP